MFAPRGLQPSWDSHCSPLPLLHRNHTHLILLPCYPSVVSILSPLCPWCSPCPGQVAAAHAANLAEGACNRLPQKACRAPELCTVCVLQARAHSQGCTMAVLMAVHGRCSPQWKCWSSPMSSLEWRCGEGLEGQAYRGRWVLIRLRPPSSPAVRT